MQFDTAAYLRKATSRAKSDVANKLISMLLHEFSRRVVATVGQSANDPSYARDVASIFGDKCAYCQRVLEPDRAAVEHLEGMNRFRIGLHVPGNVVVSCKKCNSAKRQDDQRVLLSIAESGWETFLSHDGTKCPAGCQGCAYWAAVWPDAHERRSQLEASREKISKFRSLYATSSDWSARTRAAYKDQINILYKACQESANSQIQETADELFKKLAEKPAS